MRISFPIKITALVAIGIGSSLATSAVLVKVKRAKAADVGFIPPPSVRAPTSTFVRQNPPGYQSPDGVPSYAPGVISLHKSELRALEVAGNTVHVKAAISVAVNREGASYVWAVHVLDPADGKTVLYQRIYDDQVFPVPFGVYVRPTFEDQLDLPLPQGDYVLRVGAYPVPRDAGLAGVRFDQPWLGATRGGRIHIGG
jgi:hypothetical protein